MTRTHPHQRPYVFERIENFDARRGYSRCNPPGQGMTLGLKADADLWRDPSGNVVTRLSSEGYRFSFLVSHRSGRAVLDEEMKSLCDYLADILHLWIVEGVDDEPTTENVPPIAS